MKTLKTQMDIAFNKDWSYDQNILNKMAIYKGTSGTGMLHSLNNHSSHGENMESKVHAPRAELKTGWHSGVFHQNGGTSSYIPRIYNHVETLSRT